MYNHVISKEPTGVVGDRTGRPRSTNLKCTYFGKAKLNSNDIKGILMFKLLPLYCFKKFQMTLNLAN